MAARAEIAAVRVTSCLVGLARPDEIIYTGSEAPMLSLSLFFVLIIPIVLACFGFWLWMLIDCATNEADHGNNKVVWIIIIVFAHIVGAIIYWIFRRDQRIAEVGH
jgi:Na+-driven multidrug efflux pump